MLLLIQLYPQSVAAMEALPRINLRADPSLTPALGEAIRTYAAEYGVSVSAEFEGTNFSEPEDIDKVLDVDVLITTRESVIDKLTLQGMVDVYSKTPVAANRLCFATRADNPLKLILIPRLPLAGILEKLDPGYHVILGDPMHQHSGSYALQALRHYELAGELEPSFLFMRHHSDILTELAKPGAYGIAYCSQINSHPDISARGIFEQDSHAPVVYYAVAVAGEHMETAREFINWLASKRAQAILQRYHFSQPPEKPKSPEASAPAVL